MSKWDIFAPSDIKRFFPGCSRHTLTHWKKTEYPSLTRTSTAVSVYWTLYVFVFVFYISVSFMNTCSVLFVDICRQKYATVYISHFTVAHYRYMIQLLRPAD